VKKEKMGQGIQGELDLLGKIIQGILIAGAKYIFYFH
jgi:hypothetical protein